MKKLALASLIAAVLVTPTAQAASWDLATDFANANYSGSPWTFGWEAATGLNGTLTRYDTLLTDGTGVKYWWYDFNHHSYDYTAGIGKNVGQAPVNGISPGEVALHPGWDNSFGVARWTAPVSGTFDVGATFGTGDLGWESYYISVNKSTVLQSLSDSDGQVFTFRRQLNAGDTIDFIVGVPVGWGYGYDSTPLSATITTAVPEPESYALMLAGLGLLGFMARRKKSA